MRNPLSLFKYLPHLLRKKFDEKYIIIESDDWGLERALTYDSVLWMKKKYGSSKLSRWSYDTLESPEDIQGLYTVLEKYKNKFASPPVITANFITHNVDYSSKDKLKFIPLSDGFNNKDLNIQCLYKAGMEKKFIYPQLHGFSHYNLTEMEKYFKTEEGKEALNEKFFLAKSTIRGNLKFLQGELSHHNLEVGRIREAADEFKKYFGFTSKTIIPPTFILDLELMRILSRSGISMIQSSNRLLSSKKKRMSFPHFQKRKGMYWSIRNSRLDPHEDYRFFHEQCMTSIESAFENKSPAVIDFHRVNFSGTFAPEYRAKTFEELDLLFGKIYEKWPDVQFIHSEKLNDILWQQ